MRNGKPFSSRQTASRMAAGRYTYTYEAPGRDRKFRVVLDLKPGRRYGLFVNLDSPFTQPLTNLEGLYPSSANHADAGLARLPDGRWIVAYYAEGNKIVFATSKDLVTWGKPWPLPFNSIFTSVCPALLTDPDGAMHLAYFSNRLHLRSASSGGYRLWMTRSNDGRRWSAPRHVEMTHDGGSRSAGSIHMFRAPDGRCWLFWRDFAAVAASPDEIRVLRRINIQMPSRGHYIYNPHVAVDRAGRMHMVFDNFARGIYYTRSSNGVDWADPVCLVDKEKGSSIERPLIVSAGGRAAVIYSHRGTQLRTGVLGNSLQLGPPVKITGHVAGLNGSRPYVTADGKLVLLAGSNTVWALRARLDDVVGGPTNPAR